MFFFIIGLFRNTYYYCLESICSGSILWRLHNSKLLDFSLGIGRNGLCVGFLFMMIGVEFAEHRIHPQRVTFGILTVICFCLHTVEVLIVHHYSTSYFEPEFYAMALPTCFCLLGFLLTFQRNKKTNSFLRVSSEIIYLSHLGFVFIYRHLTKNSLVLFLSVLISSILLSVFLWYAENKTHSRWFRLLY